MIVGQLAHVTIKTANVDVSRRFYTEVLGMELAERPDFGFPGIWVRSSVPGGEAILHFYGGSAAQAQDGTVPLGTSAIDHVALSAEGFHELRDRLSRYGLDWWESVVPGMPMWQIFTFDPNGVLLELNFSADAEAGPRPETPEARQYEPGKPRFEPGSYVQFAMPL